MNAYFGSLVRAAVVLAAAAACIWPVLSHADANTDIDAGRALYMQKGCYECHGTFGQGSVTTGPALAPQPIALSAMRAYVRNPQGQMPIFSSKILSDTEIALIHAYLTSIPPSPSPDSIALLNNGTTSVSVPVNNPPLSRISGSLAHGASVYAGNCAACHGQKGEGGVGPALMNISSRYSTTEIEARIREPSGVMPKLYPSPLSAADVHDVARYVASLNDGMAGGN